MYVGCFAGLFGTRRGALLQRVASSRGVALLWALGDGTDDQEFVAYSAYERAGFNGRLLDASPPNLRLVNASLARDASASFAHAWSLAAAARAGLPPAAAGSLPAAVARQLWARVLAMLPAAAQLS
eukprot:6951954-Prymnesium_polylepis.1